VPVGAELTAVRLIGVLRWRTGGRSRAHVAWRQRCDRDFQRIAAEAKASCPVSKLLDAEISLEAKLEV
jgi:organic hydroperoxide reductase OsmC/OhrA